MLNLTPDRHKTYHSPFNAELLLSRLEEILVKTKDSNFFTHKFTMQDLYNGTIEHNKFRIQRAYFGSAPTISGEILAGENGSTIYVEIKISDFYKIAYYLYLFAPI
ncbi:MAG: hypothetical protein EOP53_18075, partial [Sphingobacteriales bacterium]